MSWQASIPGPRPGTRRNDRQGRDFYEVCALSEFYKGSFSEAGKEQAILGLDACGGDRTNDITPGDVVLVERGPEGWHLVATQMGTNVRGCKTSKRNGRTLLVCDDHVGAYGDGSLWWGFTLDFARPAKQRIDVHSKLYKSAGVSCMAGPGMVVERGLTDFREVSRTFADVDGDGLEDLRVTIERAHVDGSEALEKRAEAACRQADGIVEASSLLGKYQRFQLEWRGTPTGLAPTPETSKRIEEWGKAAPDFWWNLVK